jgi:hypothetical protein
MSEAAIGYLTQVSRETIIIKEKMLEKLCKKLKIINIELAELGNYSVILEYAA